MYTLPHMPPAYRPVPTLDQTRNLVLRQCKAKIQSAALLSPNPDDNVGNLGSGLEDWQSPTT